MRVWLHASRKQGQFGATFKEGKLPDCHLEEMPSVCHQPTLPSQPWMETWRAGQWCDIPPATASLSQLTKCSCKKSCDSRRCSCFSGGLPCTGLCQCLVCSNQAEPGITASENSHQLGSNSDKLDSEEKDEEPEWKLQDTVWHCSVYFMLRGPASRLLLKDDLCLQCAISPALQSTNQRWRH